MLNKVEFRTGNILSLPFTDNIFGLVTSSSVINSLHGDKEKAKALAEVLGYCDQIAGFLWQNL